MRRKMGSRSVTNWPQVKMFTLWLAVCRRAENIDLLLSDVDMAQMSGPDLGEI
jgi:hypothetical protein